MAEAAAHCDKSVFAIRPGHKTHAAQRRVVRQPLKEGGGSGRAPINCKSTPAYHGDALQPCCCMQRIRAAQQGAYVGAEPAQAAQPGAAGQR